MKFKLIYLMVLVLTIGTVLGINIDAPLDTATLTQQSNTTFELKVTLTETITDSSKCWYNHYTEEGRANMPSYFDCKTQNSIQVPISYYGQHTLFVYFRDGDILTSDAVVFNTKEPPELVEQKIEKQQTVQEQPSLVIGQITFAATCGLDYDKNGETCDSNEDWISCPKDCNFPSASDLVCSGSDTCVWSQAWFIKLLFAGLLLVTLHLVYSDLNASPRMRRILR